MRTEGSCNIIKMCQINYVDCHVLKQIDKMNVGVLAVHSYYGNCHMDIVTWTLSQWYNACCTGRFNIQWGHRLYRTVMYPNHCYLVISGISPVKRTCPHSLYSRDVVDFSLVIPKTCSLNPIVLQVHNLTSDNDQYL